MCLCLTSFVMALAQNSYSVALADAHWNFDNYSNSKPSLTDTSFVVPNNWIVGTATTNAYRPFIYPSKLATTTADAGYDGRLCLQMMHPANASRVPIFAVLPTVSDASYSNMTLDFYAKGQPQNSAGTIDTQWSVGYLTSLADTAKENFPTGVHFLQTISLDRNNYQHYSIDLSNVPQGAYVTIYDNDASFIKYLFLDNVSFVSTDTVVPDAPVAPEMTAEVLSQDSIYMLFGDPSLNENIIGFLIYLNGTQVDSLDELSYEYVFGGLTPNTTYNVGVKAVDAFGGYSPMADTTVTTLAAPIVIVPGPATFEEYEMAAESNYLPWTADGVYAWQSGDYSFQTSIGYGGTYVTNFVITNETSTEFVDYSTANRSAAGGAHDGDNYTVCFVDAWGTTPSVTFEERTLTGFYVCNNVYALNSMVNGDNIAHAFADGDWFKLTITGKRQGVETQSVDFYLADFRNGMDSIVTAWTWVDLSTLGLVDAVEFSLSSSDNGDYGMNTPSYFCMDDFGTSAPITVGLDLQEEMNGKKAEKVFDHGFIYIETPDGKRYSLNGHNLR